jgi:hypothetical protein
MARSRRACPERSRGNPGDACWQMLLGAFRPQTTTEDKKITTSERSRGICSSTDLSWNCFSKERNLGEGSAVSLLRGCSYVVGSSTGAREVGGTEPLAGTIGCLGWLPDKRAAMRRDRNLSAICLGTSTALIKLMLAPWVPLFAKRGSSGAETQAKGEETDCTAYSVLRYCLSQTMVAGGSPGAPPTSVMVARSSDTV